jgi:hypothetical protein
MNRRESKQPHLESPDDHERNVRKWMMKRPSVRIRKSDTFDTAEIKSSECDDGMEMNSLQQQKNVIFHTELPGQVPGSSCNCGSEICIGRDSKFQRVRRFDGAEMDRGI